MVFLGERSFRYFLAMENVLKKGLRPISFFCFALFLTIFFISPPTVSIAGSLLTGKIDPSFKFSTIETEHFVIHFPQGIEEIADRAAVISEDIHSKLSSELKWSPKEKTQMVLIDAIDIANSFATVLPYNLVYIYITPPFPDSIIGEYDDWLEIVITHEYTHILTMDPVRGFSSVMRNIFGRTLPGNDPLSVVLFLSTAPPNVWMPNWWLEGIATWAETEFSPAGRGRSSYVEMIFRMAVLEGRVPRIDQLNGDIPYWPAGNTPYLYGMLLQKYIAQMYGKETLGKLNISHAGRFPFAINASAKKLTGLHYATLYKEMVNKLKEEQFKKIQYLKTEPLTDYKKIPVKGERLTNPRVSPNGKYLALNRSDPHYHGEIVVIDTESLEEIYTIRRLPSDYNVSWSPDSQKLYYTQADLTGGFNIYQDIYSYDLADDSVKRISKSLRAKDIDVSPSGKQIVFIKVEAGRQNIAFLSIDDKSVKIVSDLNNAVLSHPRWSSDERFIVFSKHYNSGQTAIELLNNKEKTTEIILEDSYNNICPTWSPDGRFIIFTSDRTGIYNIFAYSLMDKKLYQITHVLGGAFQPDISIKNGKMVFSGYNSKGFYIAELPYEPLAWQIKQSPGIKPLWNNNNEELTTENIQDTQIKKKTAVKTSEEKAYNPLPTLLPKFWMPVLSTDHEGIVFGGFTAGQDVLGYHSYTLQGGYGSSRHAYLDLNYTYDRWYPSLFLKGYSLPFLYSEFFDDKDDYFEKQTGLAAGIEIPINSLESGYSLIGGYHLVKISHLTAIEDRTVEGIEVYEGRNDNIFAGVEYKGALKYPYSISRETGRNISLLYRNYSKTFGSELNQEKSSVNYEEFVGVGKHHVLFFNLKGATSNGDITAQQAYKIGGNSSAENEYPLRGFPSGFQTGKHTVTGTLEYRFPIKYILRGLNTKPVFWDRLHLAVFTDAGNVWGYNKKFDWNDFNAGAGIEARLDMILFYKFSLTPAIGIARGITEGGETQVYLTIYSGL